MIYSKKNLTLLFTLGLLWGCSATVDQKDEKSSNETLDVTSLKIGSRTALKTDNTGSGNLVGNRYTIEACLSDVSVSKSMAYRDIMVGSVSKKTNSKGCFSWDEEHKINFQKEDRCKVLEKNVVVSGSAVSKKIRYSIDLFDNQIANLDKSKGCVGKKGTIEALSKEDDIILDDVKLSYHEHLSEKRSDAKYIKHRTEFSSCIDVKMTDKGLSRTPIKITVTDKISNQVSEVHTRTNKRGCFNGKFESKFLQYSYSQWLEKDFKVEVLSGPLAGSTTGRSIWTNPWEANSSLFGVGKVGETPIEIEEDKKVNPRMHLDGLMYIMIGNDTSKFSVNEYLGLTINKMYQVVLSPWVNLGHSYSKGKRETQRIINSGKFKLSFMILAPKTADIEINKDNFDQFEYLTGAKKIVEITNGTINTLINLPIKMTDIPRLALRTVSVFKIEPLEDIGLEPTIVTGFFKARLPWIKTNVMQSNDLNQKIIDLEAKINKAEALSYEQFEKECSGNNKNVEKCVTESSRPFEVATEEKEVLEYKKYIESLFANLEVQSLEKATKIPFDKSARGLFVETMTKKYPDLKVMTATEAKEELKINIRKKDFDSLLPENASFEGLTHHMVEEICKYAYTKDGDETEVLGGLFSIKKTWKKCKKNPAKYLQVKPLRHVKKVHKIDPLYSNGMVLGIGERASTNAGNGKNEYKSIRTGFDAAIKIPFLDFLNLGIRAVDISFTKSTSEFESFALGEYVSNGKNLGVEKFVVNVDATFDRCIMIQGKDFYDETQSGYSHRLGHKVPLYENNEAQNLGVSLYICDDKPKRETYRESWYYIQSYMNSSTMVRDHDGTTERKLLKVVRGERSFAALEMALRDITKYSLQMGLVGMQTPDITLIENWGHLLEETVTEEELLAKEIREHVEGSFPGTIE